MENEFTQEEIEEGGATAALGYIFFFLPLILKKDSRVGRYCANQGLLLTVAMVLVSILGRILSGIPLIGWIFRVAGGLVCLLLFLVGIICYVQAITNKRLVRLPYIGGLRLIP